MAENSKIEWTHHTFNPWRGCTKVSEGCANCYADTLSKRNPKTLGVWGPNGIRVVAAESAWREPLKWAAAAKAAGERHRVFCASLADVFEDWEGPMKNSAGDALFLDTLKGGWSSGYSPTGTPDRSPGAFSSLTMSDVRRRLFDLIDATPNLDWLLLTKRPENVLKMWRNVARAVTTPDINYTTTKWVTDDFTFRPNVWLGVSVENQEQADKRIPILLQTPAAVRFLSCEPLLGPVDLSEWMYTLKVEPNGDGDTQEVPCRPGLHWIIVGGESGHGARPMHPEWAQSIRHQCQDAGVPFFFKQWGEWLPFCQWRKDLPKSPLEAGPQTLIPATSKNGTHQHVVSAYRVGKKSAGRLLDGREWNEYPSPRAS